MARGDLRAELDQLAAGVGENPLADRGMGTDDSHLVIGQPSGLEQDLVGDRDLADVMKRRGEDRCRGRAAAAIRAARR